MEEFSTSERSLLSAPAGDAGRGSPTPGQASITSLDGLTFLTTHAQIHPGPFKGPPKGKSGHNETSPGATSSELIPRPQVPFMATGCGVNETHGVVPNMVRPQVDEMDYIPLALRCKFRTILRQTCVDSKDENEIRKLRNHDSSIGEKLASYILDFMKYHEERIAIHDAMRGRIDIGEIDNVCIKYKNAFVKEEEHLTNLKTLNEKFNYDYFSKILNPYNDDTDSDNRHTPRGDFTQVRRNKKKSYNHTNSHKPEVLQISNRFQSLPVEQMDSTQLITDNEDCEPTEFPLLNTQNQRPKRKANTPSPTYKRKQTRKLNDNQSEHESAKESDMEEDTSTNKRDFIKPKKNARLPPFIVTDLVNFRWEEFRKLMNESEHANHYIGKFIEKDTKLNIKVRTTEAYVFVQNLLQSSNAKFYSFQIPAKRDIRVVIKNIPYKTSVDTIANELIAKGYHEPKVTQMKKRLDGKLVPLSVFIVNLPRTENNKKIYELDNLTNLKVKVDEFKRKGGPIQCFRCQGFGHGQTTCSLPPKCVKCAENHFSNQCDKAKRGERLDEPKCANCNQKHPASFRQCPVYLTEINKWENRGAKKPPSNIKTSNSRIIENRTFAEVAANNSTNEFSNAHNVINEAKQLLKQLSDIISILKQSGLLNGIIIQNTNNDGNQNTQYGP